MHSKYIMIEGSKMHYLEAGEGNPILFLHGVPTSSFLWRKIIPYLSPLGRCIAPDLIGFGDSDKPSITYSVFDHIEYINAFIEELELEKITLVMHGWGSLIGFDYAMKNESNCMGLAFSEAFLHWNSERDLSLPYQEQLIMLNKQSNINELLANPDAYFDVFLPQLMLHTLSSDEIEEYKKPFQGQNTIGQPILQYFKELPHGEAKSKINTLISDYSKMLVDSKLPKLMLYSVPGFITTISNVMWAKEHLANLQLVDVGEELHFAPEAYPALFGETISVWIQSLEESNA